jgi:hypothetical protein
MHTSKSNYYRSKTYLLNQWMDLMYLSTLDLPRSLISESRTSASSSSQVSMASPTCTCPVHSQPMYVLTLYTDSPRTCTHPIHSQPMYVCTLFTESLRTCTHPIHRQPMYALENRVFCIRCNSENFVVNPLCYLRRSPLQMYPQVFTISFTQENRYPICTSVCLMSELCLLFISSCILTLSLF